MLEKYIDEAATLEVQSTQLYAELDRALTVLEDFQDGNAFADFEYPPELAQRLVDLFSIAMSESEGRIDLSDFEPSDYKQFWQRLDPAVMANLLAEAPIAAKGETNKALAISLSERLDYERGQDLYHFAVLTTRLIRS